MMELIFIALLLSDDVSRLLVFWSRCFVFSLRKKEIKGIELVIVGFFSNLNLLLQVEINEAWKLKTVAADPTILPKGKTQAK